MINTLLPQITVFLSNYMIEKPPGFIVGPIATFLGYILNFLFDLVYNFTIANSLGISIILLTVVARTLMLPLAFKQQKSMVAMRRLQPEMDKIKAKYGDSKDPEIQRKMSAEIQSLYSKNKVNPITGCLPMLITLPIFFALSVLMRNSYLYVNVMGDIYNRISEIVMNTSGSFDFLKPIINAKISSPGSIVLDFSIVSDVSRALNKMSVPEWAQLVEIGRASCRERV